MVESQSDKVSDKTLKICVSALMKIMEAAKRKELWDEGEKLFAQVTMHRIPTFPQEQNSKSKTSVNLSENTSKMYGKVMKNNF